jgi:hypothetical protein
MSVYNSTVLVMDGGTYLQHSMATLYTGYAMLLTYMLNFIEIPLNLGLLKPY